MNKKGMILWKWAQQQQKIWKNFPLKANVHKTKMKTTEIACIVISTFWLRHTWLSYRSDIEGKKRSKEEKSV